MDKYKELENLQKLKDEGVLSEQEFQEEKKKILSSEINENITPTNSQYIIRNYTEKINKEKKTSRKKTFKIFITTFVVAIIVCILPAAIVTIDSNIKKSKEEKLKVTVPNLIGKTYTEAQQELSNLGLEVKTRYGSSDNPEAIVTEQGKKEGYTMKKGETLEIKVLTQEEIEKQEEEQKKKDEESNAKWKATNEFTKQVESANSGSVKYVNSSYYGTTKTSGAVYKLKYTTSYENQYYYQLVSYNDDFTRVVKSTKLFSFYEVYGEEKGQKQELAYAYTSTFGE